MIARVLTVPLLVVAAVSFGESIHIKAKAVLAQRLIERAWLRTLEQGESQRPWHWADTWPVARLRSSRLSRDLFVLSGVNGGALAFGPGHFAATALPGAAGTSVVAGHRDTHFEFLQHLRVDDRLSVQDMSGDWFTYIVTERLIIDTRDSSVWSVAPTRDEIHLMTCYPFDAVAPGGPLRLIVIAERRRATSA
ncbi:MAG: class GN sortase [Gammaproteobacteria bacterium]|nr:class GN sortase [Gammaproteobacteria bacterium]